MSETENVSDKTTVTFETTPNPSSLKFIANQDFTAETKHFENQADSKSSPLANKIFGFPWTDAVSVGPNYVTVTKQDWVEWEILAMPLSNLIAEHLQNNEPIFVDTSVPTSTQKNSDANDINEDDSPVVKKIKQLLHTEIRPLVALDGGDIIFHSYVEDVLFVELKGACNGCPSASATLSEGVENKLKQFVPELIEVRSV